MRAEEREVGAFSRFSVKANLHIAGWIGSSSQHCSRAIHKAKARQLDFCLCGGLAVADLYRGGGFEAFSAFRQPARYDCLSGTSFYFV